MDQRGFESDTTEVMTRRIITDNDSTTGGLMFLCPIISVMQNNNKEKLEQLPEQTSKNTTNMYKPNYSCRIIFKCGNTEMQRLLYRK